jgi:translocation and assembly module TamB
VRRKIFVTIGLLLLVPLLLFGWLLATPKGNQLLVEWLSPENLKITAFSGSLWREIRLEAAEFQDSQQRLKIENLMFRWRPAALFDGLLHVEQLAAGKISYVATVQERDSEASAPQELALPLALRLDRFEIGNLELDQQGETLVISRIALKAESSGNSIAFTDIALSYLSHQLRADAEVTLDEQLPFKADISWRGVLPEVGPASGTARVDGDLEALNVELSGDTPLTVSGRGRLVLHEPLPTLEFAGEWSDLRWPLRTAADITSDSGRFTLTGPLDRLALETHASLGFPHGPATSVQAHLQGSVTSDGIDALLLDLQLAGGDTRVSGALQWSPSVTWDLSLKSRALDTALLGDAWQGTIALDAEVLGGISDQGPWVQADLQRLAGKLRGYPLQANGKASYDHHGTHIEALKVISGANSLQANGTVAERLQMQYAIDATDLAASWPGLQGRLKADGELTGRPDNPEITARIAASGISYQAYRVEAADANLVWRQAQAEGKADVRGFSLPGLHGRSLSLTVSGTPEQHAVRIGLDADEAQLDALAQGNWQAPRWQGQIDRLEIEQADIGRWVSAQPVKLQASTTQFRLENTCFAQHASRLCSAIQWQEGDARVTATLKALPLAPLLRQLEESARVEGRLDGELNLQGPIDALRGQAQIRLKQGLITVHADDGTLPLELRDGTVDIDIAPDRNSAKLKLKAGKASIDAQAASGSLAAGADSRFKGNLHAEIPQLSQLSLLLPGLSKVEGRLDLRARLAGTLNKPEIEGSLKLAEASAEVPQLGLTLEKAHLTAKNQGTERIVLQGEVSSGSGRLDLNGELSLDPAKGWPLKLDASGNNIQIARLPEAEILASPDLNIRYANRALDIKGSVKIPQASIEIRELPKQAVSVSDDEVIVGDDRTSRVADPLLDITSRVTVELGKKVRFKGFGLNTRIQGSVELQGSEGKNLAQGALSLLEGSYKAYGQDLTIERGRLLFNGPPHNPDLDINATRLSLDESVTATLTVSGNLRKPLANVSSTPALPDGEALSYLLTGRGLDEKSPATITMLRLAAASTGLEKSQEILDRVAAGVGVDEIRIQEGSTLEDTSLLLGKYLSPDLYVSYAVGLFDNQGALTTRYRLSKRLRLEVQSGDAQSMDLIYDVEK